MAAERLDRRLLERSRDRQLERLRVIRLALELLEDVRDRIAPFKSHELRVVRALQPGGPELPRRVADDGAHDAVAVDAERLAVRVALGARKPGAVAGKDLASNGASGRGDDDRVVGRGGQWRGLDDLPVAGTRGQCRERK